MASDASNKIINSDTGIVVDAVDVGGGYFVTKTVEITTTGDPNKIPHYACVDGAICYCTTDKQFYQCTGSGTTATWSLAVFNTPATATEEEIKKLFGTMSSTDEELGTTPLTDEETLTDEEKKKIINLAGLELFNEYVSMIDADQLLFDVDSPDIT